MAKKRASASAKSTVLVERGTTLRDGTTCSRDLALADFSIAKYNKILKRGLAQGIGEAGSKVCIEAAICEALNLPHGDDPTCVAESVRDFKIGLNDLQWSSEKARAEGLRDLGLAQLGSIHVKGIEEEFPKLVDEYFFTQVKKDEKKRVTSLIKKALKELPQPPTASKLLNSDALEDYAFGLDASECNLRDEVLSEVQTYEDLDKQEVCEYLEDQVHENNKLLLLAAECALKALRKLKSPGVKLLG